MLASPPNGWQRWERGVTGGLWVALAGPLCLPLSVFRLSAFVLISLKS